MVSDIERQAITNNSLHYFILWIVSLEINLSEIWIQIPNCIFEYALETAVCEIVVILHRFRCLKQSLSAIGQNTGNPLFDIRPSHRAKSYLAYEFCACRGEIECQFLFRYDYIHFRIMRVCVI